MQWIAWLWYLNKEDNSTFNWRIKHKEVLFIQVIWLLTNKYYFIYLFI